jgi:hypothetical protein
MARGTIERLELEAASVQREIRDTVERAALLGSQLVYIGDAVRDAGWDLCSRSSPEQLHGSAVRIDGATLHGLALLAELRSCSGRFEQLASLLEQANHGPRSQDG